MLPQHIQPSSMLHLPPVTAMNGQVKVSILKVHEQPAWDQTLMQDSGGCTRTVPCIADGLLSSCCLLPPAAAAKPWVQGSQQEQLLADRDAPDICSGGLIAQLVRAYGQ